MSWTKLSVLMALVCAGVLVGCTGSSDSTGEPPKREGTVETTAPPSGAVPPEQRGTGGAPAGDGG